MNIKKVIIKKNQYYDSVYLMGIFDNITNLEDIVQSHVMMATDENRGILELSGFNLGKVSANDLVIAIEAKDKVSVDNAIETIENFLTGNKDNSLDKRQYNSFEQAFNDNPDANLCVISVPGQYAADEAIKAIGKGLNVFIFSDNVPQEDEVRIKKLGKENNVLVMGPDCGVGSINGVALATGSVLSRGSIGIIAASGSGAQEIACIIDKFGPGVSQLIGTGGKDLSKGIGGLTMLRAMDVLDIDNNTKVIVLVSKLADISVVKKILDAAQYLSKPVVAIFLGAKKSIYEGYKNIADTYTLEEAATKAISIVSKKNVVLGFTDQELDHIADEEVKKYGKTQKYLRGLYTGGTFAEEALIILSRYIKNPLYSNINSSFGIFAQNLDIYSANLLIDMGSEEFTKGRPHPVIDPKPRVTRFSLEAEKEEVAVVILDFILSYGVHPDPAGAIVDTIIEKKEVAVKNGRYLTVISSVCGTEKDPQIRTQQEQKLKNAGVIITESNAQSARLAAKILTKLN